MASHTIQCRRAFLSAEIALSMIPGNRIATAIRRPRLILNCFLLGGFIVVVMERIVYWLPRDAFEDGLNLWAYTDWLIDYSSGFIRRGLLGGLVDLSSAITQPRTAVAVFSWLFFSAAVVGYIRLLLPSLKIFHPLTFFGLLFLPPLFLFYLNDHGAFARKEIVGYLLLVWHIYIVERAFPVSDDSLHPPQAVSAYLRGLLPIAMVLLPLLMLIHEASFLLFVPVHGLITYSMLQTARGGGRTQAFRQTVVLYVPAASAFAVAVIFGRPAVETARAICEKWVVARALDAGSCVFSTLGPSSSSGAFNSLPWSFSLAASQTLSMPPATLVKWILVILLFGVCLGYIVWHAVNTIIRSRLPDFSNPQSAGRYARVFSVRYFLLPFLLSLPVYLVGYDLGRWFAVTCINFAILGASANLQCREFVFFKNGQLRSPSTAPAEEKKWHPMVFSAVSVFICLVAVFCRLPHCCIMGSSVFQEPLKSILRSLFMP